MEKQKRSAEELVIRAMEPESLEKIKNDPLKELQNLMKQVIKDIPPGKPLETDPWIYRIVVIALGFVILTAVIGAIIIMIKVQKTEAIPDILTAIGSAAVGALAGLLAPSPGTKKD